MNNIPTRLSKTLPLDGIEYCRDERWPREFWFILLVSFTVHSVLLAFSVKWL